MQVSVLYLEPVAGDKLWFDRIGSFVANPLFRDFFLEASMPAALLIAQSL